MLTGHLVMSAPPVLHVRGRSLDDVDTLDEDAAPCARAVPAPCGLDCRRRLRKVVECLEPCFGLGHALQQISLECHHVARQHRAIVQ